MITNLKNHPHRLFFLFLFCVILLTYANSLHNDFMMDDIDLILDNPLMRHVKYLPLHFIPDINKALQVESMSTDVYYRPFAHILPMLNYLMFKDHALGHHASNLVLFFFAVVSIFYLVRALFHRDDLAYLTSFLYAAHPINGLFVNYITANVFALQIITLSVTYILYLKALHQRRFLIPLALSLISFSVALLCHETSLALPFLLLPAFLIKTDVPLSKKAALAFSFFLAAGLYFLIRITYASLHSSIITKIVYKDFDLLAFLATNIKLFFGFLSQFFYFDLIAIKWSIPAVAHHTVLWIAGFVIFTLMIFALFRQKHTTKAWGLLFTTIGFLPVCFGSSFELRYGYNLELHWMFFPATGVFIFLADTLLSIKKRVKKPLFWLFLAAITLNLLCFNWTMNQIWGNEIEYAKRWYKHSPTMKSALFYAASAYLRKGDMINAKKYFLESIENIRLDWQIYANLGMIAKSEGNFNEAEAYYLTALTLLPQSAVVHNNLGVLYKQEGDIDRAHEHFARAIGFDPYRPEPRLNLANMHIENKQWLDAKSLFQDNLRVNPNDEESLLGLLKVLVNEHEEGALPAFVNHVKSLGLSADFYLRAAVICDERAFTGNALDFFTEAVERDPHNPTVLTESGRFLANHRFFGQAKILWQDALKSGGDPAIINPLISTLP